VKAILIRVLGIVALSLCLLLAVMGPVEAGSYSRSPNLIIPDMGSTSDSINVTEVGLVTSVTVSVDIAHNFIGDLEVRLTAPSGTTVTLYDAPCGTMNNLRVTYSDAGAAFSCSNSASWGTFRPQNPLSAFIGESAAGNWTMSVADTDGGVLGTFDAWTLNLTTGPYPPPPVPTDFPYIAPQINDGRVNMFDVAAPVAIYEQDGQLAVYGIDPATGTGLLVGAVPLTDLVAAPQVVQPVAAEVRLTMPDGRVVVYPVDPAAVAGLVGVPEPAARPADHRELFSGIHPFFNQSVAIHLLNTGEVQVTAYDSAGQNYIFIWTPD
jgi:subtilisin-like proprotein convertase family protein